MILMELPKKFKNIWQLTTLFFDNCTVARAYPDQENIIYRKLRWYTYLVPHKISCDICGSTQPVIWFNYKMTCYDCLEKISLIKS